MFYVNFSWNLLDDFYQIKISTLKNKLSSFECYLTNFLLIYLFTIYISYLYVFWNRVS
jgi:hypothetical protein